MAPAAVEQREEIEGVDWKYKYDESRKALHDLQKAFASLSHDLEKARQKPSMTRCSSQPMLSRPHPEDFSLEQFLWNREQDWISRERKLLSEKALLAYENAKLKRQIEKFTEKSSIKRVFSEPNIIQHEITSVAQKLAQMERDLAVKEEKLKNEMSILTAENSRLKIQLRRFVEELVCTPRGKSSSSSSSSNSSGDKYSILSDSSKSSKSMEDLGLLEYDGNSLMPIEEEIITKEIMALALDDVYDPMMTEATVGNDACETESSNFIKIEAPCPNCSLPGLFELNVKSSSLQGAKSSFKCQECGADGEIFIKMASSG